MISEDDNIETLLWDVGEHTIDSLREMHERGEKIDVSRELKMIEKPRYNLGGQGPPGRAD